MFVIIHRFAAQFTPSNLKFIHNNTSSLDWWTTRKKKFREKPISEYNSSHTAIRKGTSTTEFEWIFLLSVIIVVNFVCISYLHLFMAHETNDEEKKKKITMKRKIRGAVNATNAIASMLGKWISMWWYWMRTIGISVCRYRLDLCIRWWNLYM